MSDSVTEGTDRLLCLSKTCWSGLLLLSVPIPLSLNIVSSLMQVVAL